MDGEIPVPSSETVEAVVNAPTVEQSRLGTWLVLSVTVLAGTYYLVKESRQSDSERSHVQDEEGKEIAVE